MHSPQLVETYRTAKNFCIFLLTRGVVFGNVILDCGRFTCDCARLGCDGGRLHFGRCLSRVGHAGMTGDPTRISPSVGSKQEASHDELR
jgi:hypothetical protein